MNRLALDIGNSHIKAGVFLDERLVEVRTFQHNAFPTNLDDLLNEYAIRSSIVASVAEDDPSIYDKLRHNGLCFIFDHRTTIPLTNRYQSPETLGLDRLAAVVGGYGLYPNRDVLVIDAGTCITFDLVNQQGEYLGGGISPGLEMRLKAMHYFTGRLPAVELHSPTEWIGQTTEKAMLSGTVNGALAEVDGVIRNYQHLYPDLVVLLTGGDMAMFESNLKSDIFAISHLVLVGLNQILAHHDAD
jgi:type III pantothenate kinase